MGCICSLDDRSRVLSLSWKICVSDLAVCFKHAALLFFRCSTFRSRVRVQLHFFLKTALRKIISSGVIQNEEQVARTKVERLADFQQICRTGELTQCRA